MRAKAVSSIRGPSSSREHLADLREDGSLAVALEIQSIERLLPSRRAHDLVDVHGDKIMDRVREPDPARPASCSQPQRAPRRRWRS